MVRTPGDGGELGLISLSSISAVAGEHELEERGEEETDVGLDNVLRFSEPFVTSSVDPDAC